MMMMLLLQWLAAAAAATVVVLWCFVGVETMSEHAGLTTATTSHQRPLQHKGPEHGTGTADPEQNKNPPRVSVPGCLNE